MFYNRCESYSEIICQLFQHGKRKATSRDIGSTLAATEHIQILCSGGTATVVVVCCTLLIKVGHALTLDNGI